jgi:hypothetical protein
MRTGRLVLLVMLFGVAASPAVADPQVDASANLRPGELRATLPSDVGRLRGELRNRTTEWDRLHSGQVSLSESGSAASTAISQGGPGNGTSGGAYLGPKLGGLGRSAMGGQ